MQSNKGDAIIVGAGIVGLASAFALAQRDIRVTVVDGAIASGSSQAAAGMLAPGAESTPEHAELVRTTVRARAMWPHMVGELHKATDCRVMLHEVGTLLVGWDAGDRRELDRYRLMAREQGLMTSSLNRDQAPEAFELLSDRVTSGEFARGDAFVVVEDVLAALVDACTRLGVLFVNETATECASESRGVVVATTATTFRASYGIIATGYANPPLTLVAQSKHQLRPVRGITIRLRSTPREGAVMIRGYVRGRSVYAIHRPDGTIVVGATSDESDELIAEASAVRQLLDDALTLLPNLEIAEFCGVRVGLRPAACNNLPFFDDQLSPGWAWSSGHFRHGFLLAPVAAEAAVHFAMSVGP